MPSKKSISFDNIIYVYNIPPKEEYNDIKYLLWWTSFDYKLFRHNYIKNI